MLLPYPRNARDQPRAPPCFRGFANGREGVGYVMPLILILIGNFFVFICCLIGAQACYFKCNWKWFTVSVLCVLVSAACILLELSQWLFPPEHQTAVFVHQPTTSL